MIQKETTIALNNLTISKFNVRKSATDTFEDNALKASIAAHGLLQNLIVHETPGVEGQFEVDAGRRRLRALQELAEEHVIQFDHHVSCHVIPDSSTAVEASLAENTMRLDMHPADQVVAFKELVEQGSTAADIALHFGLTDRLVQQRLRLGNVAPPIMEAYREGRITLEVMTAFTLTTDQVRQEEVWTVALEQEGRYLNAYDVRKRIITTSLRGDNKVVKFLGIEAYERAGGTSTRDMFAEEDARGLYLDDANLVHDLALKKLAKAAKPLKKDWKWAEARISFDWEDRSDFKRVYAEGVEPTPEEITKIDEIETRREELIEIQQLEEITNEIRLECEELDTKEREIESNMRSRRTFAEEDRAIAGCVVTIDWAGEITVEEGLVRPEDMPKTAATLSTNFSPTDQEKVIRQESGYTKKMMDAMRQERTNIIHSALTKNFAATFDMLLFQLARNIFGPDYVSNALDIDLFRIGSRYKARENHNSSRLALEWMEETDTEKSFIALRKLTTKRKQTLFTHCIALTLKGQLTIDLDRHDETESVIDSLEIPFNTQFRPTVENFWGSLSKKNMLAIGEDILGHDWAKLHAATKKMDLAEIMEGMFAVQDNTSTDDIPETYAAILAWTPPGFTEAK